MKKIISAFLVVFLIVPAALAADSTYYVVRHAEKMDGDNPVLTQKGVQRAAHIAGMLKDAPLKAIYSTDTNRTIMTATATAAAKGLAVELFSTDDLQAFADKLKAMDGTYLIVAHSSSTPDLASLLSGTTQPKLDESDYEQLFIVTITDGAASLEQTTTTFND